MQILDNASHMFCGTRTFIGFNNIWDRAGFPNLAVIYPQGGVAELGEKTIGVGGKHQNTGAFHQLLASTAPIPSSRSKISGSMEVTTPRANLMRMPVE